MEHVVWLRVAGMNKVFSIANEDLERSTEEKTSAVHFMRFELDSAMITALREGAALSFGCDHAGYPYETEVSAETKAALLQDLA